MSTNKYIKGDLADSYLTNKKYIYDFYVSKNDRTQLRQEIEKRWVGQNYSNIGLGHQTSINWSTRKISIESLAFSRTDIYVISIHFGQTNDHYNLFIEPNLDYTINSFDVTNSLLFQDHEKIVYNYLHYYLNNKDIDYIQRQQKWFDEKPYMKIDGKTPEEAVKILKSLGW
jgi:hypothetical protein